MHDSAFTYEGDPLKESLDTKGNGISLEDSIILLYYLRAIKQSAKRYH